MKKQIIIATLALGAFVFGINNAQAQDSNPVSTTVNIQLADVICIDAISSEAVNFSYTTSQDYNNYQEHTIASNLSVTSSKGFNINVRAEGNHFEDSNNSNRYKIPVEVLKITAVTGGTMNGTFKEIQLARNSKTLVEGAEHGAQRTLNIKYSISETDAKEKLLGLPANTYTQKVKYTATAI